jgi:catechol 2,3-dioxygenase-like lactoylglutathione lyase family enzyme
MYLPFTRRLGGTGDQCDLARKVGRPDCGFSNFSSCRLGRSGSHARESLRMLLDSEEQMISGAHIVVYSKNAEADRAFFRDVLGFKSVDAGHGWLIFALPPGEAAVHPSDASGAHELYFMCDDLKVEMTSLEEKGVECSKVQEQRWGSITKMRLPGGGEVGLYQPKHPTALDLK